MRSASLAVTVVVVAVLGCGTGSSPAREPSDIQDRCVPSVVAGQGAPGYLGDGGPAAMASFARPRAVSFDAAGRFAVADFDNHVVRLVDVDGVIHTVLGVGAPTPVSAPIAIQGVTAEGFGLNGPTRVEFDEDGTLLVADHFNHRVIRLDISARWVTPVAGTGVEGFSGDSGPAVEAELFKPRDFVRGPAALLIADLHNGRIRAVTPNGIIRTVAGTRPENDEPNIILWERSPDGVPAMEALLGTPYGLAFDPHTGRIYYSDAWAHRLVYVAPEDGRIWTLATGQRQGDPELEGDLDTLSLWQPRGLVVGGEGVVLVADLCNHRVVRIDPATRRWRALGAVGTTCDSLATVRHGPIDVAIGPDGCVYAADHGQHVIRRLGAF